MKQRPPQPPHALDAEERGLARALPRLHGRATPGPDMDASILAAAQAAVRPAKPSQFPARPRIRWIAPAALAASMVLAVGMAWQLRPLPKLQSATPNTHSDMSDMQTAVTMEPAPSDQPMQKMQARPVPAPEVPPARPQTNAPAISSQQAQPVPRERRVHAPMPPLSPPAAPAPAAPPPAGAAEAASPATTLDTQTSERVLRERTSAPVAGSASAMTRDAASINANKAGVADNAGREMPKAVGAAPVAPEVRNEAFMAAEAGFVDDPDEDIPPATAASPAVRDAWLNRIGELLEQGNRQEAKASLIEFRHRYPAAVLPPRLRALEIEP